MKTVAQLLVYRYNTRLNAYGGDRDRFNVVDVTDAKEIMVGIIANLEKMAHDGYVLVKYAGRMFLCENNNVCPTDTYLRHEINYHPMERHFTV